LNNANVKYIHIHAKNSLTNQLISLFYILARHLFNKCLHLSSSDFAMLEIGRAYIKVTSEQMVNNFLQWTG